MTHRHRFCRAFLASVLVIGIGSTFVTEHASAAAPIVGTQAPGYYRLMLGDIEVTALSDGTIDFRMDKLLIGASADTIKGDYRRAFQSIPAESSMNQFIVNTGSRLVLVDTGAGTFYGATLGKMTDNLRSAGYAPEQIDEVVITHMHADHIGGLVTNGDRTFPNAVLRVDKAEFDYWMNPANEARASKAVRINFDVAQKTFGPYIAAGKIQLFDGETPIAPGIRAIPQPGHTPGHSFIAVESKGKKLVLWGDVVHSSVVQFRDPSVRIVWDSDNREAERVRLAAFADAARNGYLIGAAHLPFPSFGHVARSDDGKGFIYVPLNYTQNRQGEAKSD
ncbi:MBL fold metallo-hydrolase [Luteibacter sp. dw_328]|uniref:MBL fold metallo-hydrolase n=1 Tax=Luteibacter sp. dw_328 TaxID=2719796 RepID=UPI001BD54384|nr:MBL fold metallo-hydrolase [Luteibacter sp. dw_328]